MDREDKGFLTPVGGSALTTVYPSPPDSTDARSFEKFDAIPQPQVAASSPTVPKTLVDLRLGEYLSSGRLADTFRATLAGARVVVKLIDLESFKTYDPEKYDLWSASAALANEIELYLGILAPLRGGVVPRLHALMVQSNAEEEDMEGVVMMVLEDVGEAVAEYWDQIPPLLR